MSMKYRTKSLRYSEAAVIAAPETVIEVENQDLRCARAPGGGPGGFAPTGRKGRVSVSGRVVGQR